MQFLSRGLTAALCSFLIFTFSIFTMMGCAGYNLHQASTTTPQSPQTPEAGALALSASSFNFSTVVVGETGKQSLQITNTGNKAVSITAMTIGDKEFSIAGKAAPMAIQPSESLSYTVSFKPTTTGAATTTLSIASNAAVSPQEVSLSGMGTKATAGSNPPPASPTPEEHKVHLKWDESRSKDSIGYVVYRSETSNGTYSPLFGTAIKGNSYDDKTVIAGTTYYYVVTTVDASGTQSVHSNRAEAAVP